MSVQTQHLQNMSRGGENYVCEKYVDTDDNLRRILPNNHKGSSDPNEVGQCKINMVSWQHIDHEKQSIKGLWKSERTIIVPSTSVIVERECVFCKNRGVSFISPQMCITMLTIIVVVLAFGMMHAHMKLSDLEKRLAKMEDERSENKGTKNILFDNMAADEQLGNLSPQSNTDEATNDNNLMGAGDVEEASARTRRDTEKKSKKKKGQGKKKVNTCNKEFMNEYCFDKIEGLPPVFNEFEGSFYSNYKYDSFKKKDNGCYNDITVAMHPEVCMVETVSYKHQGSPLSFYVAVNKGANKILLNVTNNKNGEFTIQESGIFLMQFNIVMLDHHKNRSIGVFIDDTPVMACPPGGFQKPNDMEHYRICSFNGILQMIKGNKLQLKTMESQTKVRIQKETKSVIKVTLLHRLSADSK